MNKIKCPYCAEEILADAKKCKHCGEWLYSPSNSQIFSPSNSTIDARAVSKGIKDAQYSKTVSGILGIVALAIAIPFGVYIHWIAGVIVFVVLCSWIGKHYYRE